MEEVIETRSHSVTLIEKSTPNGTRSKCEVTNTEYKPGTTTTNINDDSRHSIESVLYPHLSSSRSSRSSSLESYNANGQRNYAQNKAYNLEYPFTRSQNYHVSYDPNPNACQMDGGRFYMPPPCPNLAEATHISMIANHIYDKFINEIKQITFKGPMADFTDKQTDQVIASLPPFIDHGTWYTNNSKKARIFPRYRLNKNQIIARISAPLSPNINVENTNILYERFLNSIKYEEPWIKVIRDSSFHPNVDIYFYGPDIVYETNSIIERGVQIVANFRNLHVHYFNHMPSLFLPYQFTSSPKYNRNNFDNTYNRRLPPPQGNYSYQQPMISTHVNHVSTGGVIENSTIAESYTQSPPIIVQSSVFDDMTSNNATELSTRIHNSLDNRSCSTISGSNINSPVHLVQSAAVTKNLLPQDNKYVCPEDQIDGFKCPHCGRLFSYQSYLEKHLRFSKCVDDGQRPFPCHLCRRSFNKSERLRVHISHVHEKNRPYICSFCNKAFTQSSSLNKHLRHHTGEKPYSCKDCGRRFSASSILRTHSRQHSGEKPFKCVTCGRAFSSHASLDSHAKRAHNSEFP